MSETTSGSVRWWVRRGADFAPVAFFRRRESGGDIVDERYAGDGWMPDTRGAVDRAERFPLDSDLDEISAVDARRVLDMIAARTYTPLLMAGDAVPIPAPPADPVPWEQQGCAVCRAQWERGDRPPLIAEDVPDHSSVHRCSSCGTLWLLTERYATAVTADEVRPVYGDRLDD